MTGPAFLTTREVAALLRVKERKVYDMAAAGEIPCRRVTGKLLFPRVEIEHWLGEEAADPGPARAPARQAAAVVAGSHDPLLDWALRAAGSGLATLFDGSLDGLDRVARGEAQAAGLHVFEPAADDWNLGLVSARLSASPVVLVGWATRQQGVILGPRAADAASLENLRGLRLANRQAASGAGLLFTHLLSEASLSASDFEPAGEIARTETEAAAAVAEGRADAAPGLEAAARQFGLGFLPTRRERFDLVIDRRSWFDPPLQALFGFARGEEMEAKAAALGGYDLSSLGEVRWNAPV